MNKNGKTSPVVWVLLILVVGAVVYFGVLQDSSSIRLPGASSSGSLSDCQTAPYMDNATFDKYAKATGVAVTYYSKLKGSDAVPTLVTTGSSGTDFAGGTYEILSTASAVLDQVDEFTVDRCGANKFQNFVSQADGGTLDILTSAGVSVSDDATVGSSVNLTDGGSTARQEFRAKLTAPLNEDTGKIYLTFEMNDTEVDSVSISPYTANAKVIDNNAEILDLFATEGTGSKKFAFIVDSINDGSSAEYTIAVTPETGGLGLGVATGYVYGNAYAGQWFIDDDGSYAFGWEDSDGTVKYETAFADHDALFS